jgi:prepilin-type processing-associated H-X9-DG protein
MSSPQADGAPKRTNALLIVTIVLVCLLGFCVLTSGVLVALLLPAVQAAREAARRNVCTTNLRYIGIALQAYQSSYGTLPPAYVADADGKPMHSWRVLILPFLERQDLYARYKFDEPWDGPNNSKLAAEWPNVYHCPSGTDTAPLTSYVAVVGAETVWPVPEAGNTRDVRDGVARTILLVEVEGAGIPWTEPRDLTVDEALRGINSAGPKPKPSSHHSRGANMLFCDGSVHLVPDHTSSEQLRALLTTSGGEAVDFSD